MNIGFDVGARHISSALVDEGGNIKYRLEPVLHRKIKENDLIKVIKSHISQYLKETDNIQNIGISLPGNCKNGILLEAPNIGIKNLNIKNALSDINIPINIENDAVCSLLAERHFGNLKDSPVSLLLTFGTDIGYAISNIIENKTVFATDYFRDNLSCFNKKYTREY